MIVKQKQYTPFKMVKGITNAKQKDGNYFHAKNIRLNTHLEKTRGGFVFEKGNDLSIVLPIVTVDYASTSFKYTLNGVAKTLSYKTNSTTPRNEIEDHFADQQTSISAGVQMIIGNSVTRNGLLLFSTDSKGFDCIWYIPDTTKKGVKDIELKYCRNIGLSIDFPIEAHSNYENENIDKTYWVDGNHQQRSINIVDPDLINMESSLLDMVGDFDLSQPKIIETFEGGMHTAGMIQYAYNLYRINGSQTKISPLSELVALDKNTSGGGALNEVVSETVVVKVSELDLSYTNIKLYAIKYTSYNQQPSVSVIADQTIPSSSEVIHYDDGSVLFEVSNETFLFLGGDVIIPKNMEVKNNRMFLSNYREKAYELVNKDGEDVAMGIRAFSFDNTQNTKIANSMIKGGDGSQVAVEPIYEFSSSAMIRPYESHSCINTNYKKYIYNKDGQIGGSGEFLKYTLKRSVIDDIDGFTDEDTKGRFFKDGELYRISIQFYDKYGTMTAPKWIADFVTQQVSNGNLNGFYGTIEVELLPAFYTWLNNVEDDLKPIGYKILRAERTLKDKTIITQGIINGMIAIAPQGSYHPNSYTPEAIEFANNKATKIPSMMRTFGDDFCPMRKNSTYLAIPGIEHPLGISGGGRRVTEIYDAAASDDSRKMSYQFNKLMQFHSPEIEFDLISNINSNFLSVIGILDNTETNMWAKEIDVNNKNVTAEIKIDGYLSPFDNRITDPDIISGELYAIGDNALIGPSGAGDRNDNYHFYREYSKSFSFRNPGVKYNYELYGRAEIAERGQGAKTYNKDPQLKYMNSLELLSSDNAEETDAIEEKGVNRTNSYLCRSAYIALDQDGKLTEERTGIEDIYSQMGFTQSAGVLLTEFKIEDITIYVGSLYGGNSYEDKKRTNYIEIGDYKKIDENKVFIKSPGDTFVSDYKFERISPIGTEVNSNDVLVLTEIVSFTTETSIDLERRNDLSIQDWDNKFQPVYEDYKKYNRVYSQDPNFIYRRDNEYTFKAVHNFETSIIATSEKIPNEQIDNWTNLLVNEQINLDGRYGPINALISFGDEVFAFQDRAVSRISILPRVQVTGDDGDAVQLGTGALFNDYKYITTKSGSINKWSVIATEIGLYYVDAYSKAFMSISGAGVKNISDEQEFHKEFQEIIDLDVVSIDNPLKLKGIAIGFDHITKDIYISIFKNNSGCTTYSYNENSEGFTSEYDYNSPMYIFNKKEMLSISPYNGGLGYKFFEGKHNMFYGVNKPSLYSVILSPEPTTECIFNNLEYNSLATDINGVEVLKTWESVRLYNEFQDSKTINLIDRDNIRKKNRQYRMTLPRQFQSRDRIRNNWCIIELVAKNIDGNSILMNDIILSYTPNYITIR
jgi:hypothetical protein